MDRVTEIEGAALEGLVGQHLHAWCDMQELPHLLKFWRTRNGLEVDFVVYGPHAFLGVEVKNSTRILGDDLKNLKSFSQEYPEAQVAILYRGSKRLVIDDILCIPCEEFLLNIHPKRPLSLTNYS